MKCKQSCPRFELGLQCPFPTMLNIALRTFPQILFNLTQYCLRSYQNKAEDNIGLALELLFWVHKVFPSLRQVVLDNLLLPDDCLDIYIVFWPSWLGLQNTLTASLQRGKTPPTSVLDMILNSLMVRIQ